MVAEQSSGETETKPYSALLLPCLGFFSLLCVPPLPLHPPSSHQYITKYRCGVLEHPLAAPAADEPTHKSKVKKKKNLTIGREIIQLVISFHFINNRQQARNSFSLRRNAINNKRMCPLAHLLPSAGSHRKRYTKLLNS